VYLGTADVQFLWQLFSKLFVPYFVSCMPFVSIGQVFGAFLFQQQTNYPARRKFCS